MKTVTVLKSCLQVLSKKQVFGAFSMSVNGEPTRVLYAFVKKNMVRYIRLH